MDNKLQTQRSRLQYLKSLISNPNHIESVRNRAQHPTGSEPGIMHRSGRWGVHLTEEGTLELFAGKSRGFFDTALGMAALFAPMVVLSGGETHLNAKSLDRLYLLGKNLSPFWFGAAGLQGWGMLRPKLGGEFNTHVESLFGNSAQALDPRRVGPLGADAGQRANQAYERWLASVKFIQGTPHEGQVIKSLGDYFQAEPLFKPASGESLESMQMSILLDWVQKSFKE